MMFNIHDISSIIQYLGLSDNLILTVISSYRSITLRITCFWTVATS